MVIAGLEVLDADLVDTVPGNHVGGLGCGRWDGGGDRSAHHKRWQDQQPEHSVMLTGPIGWASRTAAST